MTMKVSPRVLLVMIASLFLLPLLVAWLMYNGTIAYKPAVTRNFGTLVEPPVPLDWQDAAMITGEHTTVVETRESLGDHWVVLYPLPDHCLENCLQKITALRQIHIATGRQQHRIRIALLVPEARDPDGEIRLRRAYAKFDFVDDTSGHIRKALGRAASGPDVIYLIDPLGNIMMTYEAGVDPNDLKQDLKRLLTWSKLDEQ